MLDPDMPDFAGRHRNLGLALDALDFLDELVDRLVLAEDCLVADHDAVDIQMPPGQIDYRAHFALVSLFVCVDPGADGGFQSEFAGNPGNEVDAGGRGI